MTHRRLEYQHALRGVAYLRMLAGERSPKTPIGADRWGNESIPDYPPISEEEELERLQDSNSGVGAQGSRSPRVGVPVAAAGCSYSREAALTLRRVVTVQPDLLFGSGG